MRYPFALVVGIAALCYAPPCLAKPHHTPSSALHGFIVYVQAKADRYDALMFKGAPGTPARTLVEHLPKTRVGTKIAAPGIDATGGYVAFVTGNVSPDGLRVWVVSIGSGAVHRIVSPTGGGAICDFGWAPRGSLLGLRVKRGGSSRLCVWRPGRSRATEIPSTNGVDMWEWSGGNVLLLDDSNHKSNLACLRSPKDGR
jgi:hypothetical protein